MTSEKTLYWVAVALLAVFLGNHFANRYQGRCPADRAMATIQHLSSEAGQVSAITQAMFQDNSRFSGLDLAMARMQASSPPWRRLCLAGRLHAPAARRNMRGWLSNVCNIYPWYALGPR